LPRQRSVDGAAGHNVHNVAVGIRPPARDLLLPRAVGGGGVVPQVLPQ
jgi:hypothetical protein